jgi:hypothetical protein
MDPMYGNDPREKSGITASAAVWVVVVLMTALVAATALVAGTGAMTRISDLSSPSASPTAP